MAFIDLEFDGEYFRNVVAASLTLGRAVPFPTLAPLGEAPMSEDRLIARLDWLDTPVWDRTGVPGFRPVPGVGVLRVGVRIDHVGVAELRADPHAPGVTVLGRLWMSMTVSPGRLRIAAIAFAADGATAAVLPHPLPLTEFALPPLPVAAVVAGVVVDDSIVALRFGTTAADDLGAPPAHALDARAAESGANWLLHVPAQVFQDLVVTPLTASLAKDTSVSVEEAPSSSWDSFGGESWGVHATAGVVKKDACPGIGGEVDISITLAASLQLTLVTLDAPETGDALDLLISQSVDASDWDSFRCWLGSGGVLGAVVGLLNPVLGVGVALGTLAGISETIRSEVSDGFGDADAPTVPGVALKQVSKDDESASYSGRLGLPTVSLPLTFSQEWDLNERGLDCYGQSVAALAERRVSFAPDGGTLSFGDWSRRINCSHRTIDQAFSYQGIWVKDERWFGNRLVTSLPVDRFLTSIAEPMGQGSFERLGLGIFVLHAQDGGAAGWALLHTSAGLRVFTLDPVPPPPSAGPDSRHLVEVFCDAQREFDLVADLERLQWPEPPPEYDFGFDPLRQWQIVLDAITPDADVVVTDARDGRRLLAPDDFERRGDHAFAQLVTDADTELVVRVHGADRAGVLTARRWLVPLERRDGLTVEGPSTTTPGQLVQVGHEGSLVIAIPGQMTS